MGNKLTLIDLAKRTGNNAKVGLVESLIHSNSLLKILPVKEIAGTSYRFGRRAGLPTVTWRGFNQGLDSSKSVIEQITIECKNLGGRSEVDKLLAESDLRGVNAFRAEEDSGFIAAMGNAYNYSAYYGNSTENPRMFDGIGTVLNSLSKQTVIDAGGSGSECSSIYAVAARDAVSAQGKIRGVEMPLANGKTISATDMGLQYVNDANSKQYLAFVTEFEFQPGLAIYDERSIGRICNITSSAKPTISMINHLITAMHPFKPSRLFCSTTVYNYIQELKGTTFVSVDPLSGSELFERVLTFDGVPIEIDENITMSEEAVA
jgi:hypothetical protein